MQCQESLAFTTAGVTCPGKHAVMILLMSLGSWGGAELRNAFFSLPHYWDLVA